MKQVKIGIIGLGPTRGCALLWLATKIENVKIVALCDRLPERIDEAKKIMAKEHIDTEGIMCSANHKEVIAKAGMDAVIVSTSWNNHIDLSVDALNAGIPVGMEVGGAYSEEDCWRLVRAVENTGTPFMFLENCCYDKAELLVTSLVRNGVLGKIVSCEGAYSHDLREEIITGKEKKHYRLNNYIHRNCENYPTHELGPIAKLLNINRGNRMLSLTSFANTPIGMAEYAKKIKREEYYGLNFTQSDVVYTLIKCANGEVVNIKLCTTVPRYYDRGLTVQGTKGLFSQPLSAVFLDGDKDGDNAFGTAKRIMGNALNYENYLPEIWKNMTEEQIESGHGGCDYIMMKEFIECIAENKPTPIDVYDAVSLMCVSYLSEQSLALGGMPRAIPDFTRGKWIDLQSSDVLDLPKINF